MLIFLIQLGNPDSLLYFQELVVYLFRICHGLVNQMVWVHVHEEALSLFLSPLRLSYYVT